MTTKQALQSLSGDASRAVAVYRRYGPPVPSRKGGRTGETESGQRRPAGFRREDEARSANNAWFSSALARKSLIVEGTAATTYRRFATSRDAFAINVIFAPVTAAPHSSLSISLKKKKKQGVEEREPGRTACHQSRPFRHQLRVLPIFWAMSFLPPPVVSDGI